MAATPPAPVTRRNPRLAISRRAAERVRGGHAWVYRSELEAGPKIRPGAVIDLTAPDGSRVGTAVYSTASTIAARLLSRGTLSEDEVLNRLLPERLRQALLYRREVVRESNACRLVFSEADRLPGLIVDRYNDIVVFQALTQAFDRADFKEKIIQELAELARPASIVERTEARIRGLEELPPSPGGLVWSAAEARLETEFSLNGLRFRYQALAGQKTGAYLDQRENYAAVAAYARGRALDCFCYQGGFALHAARVCEQVTGVDSSRAALEAAEENLERNRDQIAREVEWIEGNVFDLLRDYAAAGEKYETIVLDPPPFAKNRAALPAAMRAYKELNLRALKMLVSGGILATCSCSHHVSEAEFLAVLGSAAADAGRLVRILERRGAARDHPAVVTLPESNYLKCIIVSVSD